MISSTAIFELADGRALLVLSGPSGVGKDTVVARLNALHPEVHCAVTATTRAPRPDETEGASYFFLGQEQFRLMLDKDQFLEHAVVYGHRYGVPVAPIKDALTSGFDVVVKTDVQGAWTIRQKIPRAVLVFLQAPSLTELQRRLRDRSTESEQQLAVRIQKAQQELEQAVWFDHVVMNPTDDLDQAVSEIMEIIKSARFSSSR